MFKLQIVLNSLAGHSVTVLLEFLTALLEYIDFLTELCKLQIFPLLKLLIIISSNASIIPDSHTYLLCPK